jgi:hypothetical protein
MSEIKAILEERGKTHGPFRKHAALSQGLKMANMFCKDVALTNTQQEAVDMILHKVARVLNGSPDHKDHWDDIAGYATLGMPKPQAIYPKQTAAFVPTFNYMMKVASTGNLYDLPKNMEEAVTRILSDVAGIMSGECSAVQRWAGIVNAAGRVSFELEKTNDYR